LRGGPGGCSCPLEPQPDPAALPSGTPAINRCGFSEIISPAGFERFFAELVERGGVAQTDRQTLADLCARYELEMNPDSVPGLIQHDDLRFPERVLDKREPVAGPLTSIMKRTPMLPRNPALPSRGPTTFAATVSIFVVMFIRSVPVA
jgi:hypothetical protein